MAVLDDRVAIVTGAARGIGRATVELLMAHGARVVVCDLDADACHEAVRELGPDATAIHGDVTHPATPAAVVAHAEATWGRLDILVNNAGYALDAPLHRMGDDAFQRMLDVHVVAPFRMARAAAPLLREPAKRERAAGEEVFRKIVNVSSISGTMGLAGQANYSAGKAAVVGLTKSLAKEWGPLKVNVNAVAFGWIETRMTAAKGADNAIEIDGERVPLGIPDSMLDLAATEVPLGRKGTPEEAAGGIFFLCSPWADYVHGQTLHVTGGVGGGMTG